MNFPDLEAAEHEAAVTAAAIGRDRLPTGEAGEVQDAESRRLVMGTVSMRVERG